MFLFTLLGALLAIALARSWRFSLRQHRHRPEAGRRPGFLLAASLICAFVAVADSLLSLADLGIGPLDYEGFWRLAWLIAAAALLALLLVAAALANLAAAASDREQSSWKLGQAVIWLSVFGIGGCYATMLNW